MTSSLEYSAVKFIVGWNMLTWYIKAFSESLPCSQMKNVIYVPTPDQKFPTFFPQKFPTFFAKV